MNLIHKYMFTVLAFILVGSLVTTHALASDKIIVFSNGSELAFDVDPRIEDSRTLVPLRKIFESLGAAVSYDSQTQTVYATKDGTSITLVIGSNQPIINGQQLKIDVPAKIIDGRTLVPLRFVSESLGAKVNWDSKSRIITIHTESETDIQPSVINIY
ncbi:copper amine oxidase N-terminal domain-containing protein [Bacillus sp. Marseille-P3661]|uniref:copper amine oxidase N-terminal domain-containing protein n=1 Tax=Bacillus sp. Marseille-P3661 TaxID=1936234 RepID=UPI000C829568|nr:copper amine oxidase N-terminal domain-containing protein [Bacillus sp. Marseille-P3661]